MNTPWL